jgi:hypothetical protein
MTITLMLLWLSIRNIEQKDIPLQVAPQVVAPLSMDEYLLGFKSWARNEVRKRQLLRVETGWELKI